MRNKIVNCTPHPIVVETTEFNQETGEWYSNKYTFNATGNVARVSTQVTKETPILLDSTVIVEFKMESVENTGIEGLPEPVEGRLYIVSAMVLEAGKVLGRKDLIAPNTNKATRNDQGHIVSVPGFII